MRLRWRQDPLTGGAPGSSPGWGCSPGPAGPDRAHGPARVVPLGQRRLETATFQFPPELTAVGRIRCGRAVVVANIVAYATHSAVGIYDPGSHFLDLEELTSALVGDALAAMVRHAHRVRRLDPTAA